MVALDIFVLSDGEWHLRPSLFVPLVNGSLFSFLFRFLIFSPQTYNHLFVPPGRLGSGICCSYTIAHNSKIHWVCMQPRPRSANATQKQQADTKGRLGNILGRSGQFPVVWVQFQLCSSIGSFLWVFREGEKASPELSRLMSSVFAAGSPASYYQKSLRAKNKTKQTWQNENYWQRKNPSKMGLIHSSDN